MHPLSTVSAWQRELLIETRLKRRRRTWKQLRARGESRRRKTRRNQQARRGRWGYRIAGGVEWVGVVGRRTWEAKRRKRISRLGGVRGQVYVGVLLRGSVRREAR